MRLKFLHAADIHLDSPMRGLDSRAGVPADLARASTRAAFGAMIDLAIAEDVAFVVIAGDLYDGDWKDFSTGLFFTHEMARLNRPCFLLRGNHDARSVITRNLAPPRNVREFSSRTCESFDLPECGVVLHGHSFPNRAVEENLAAGYRPPVPGRLNIGVLHTSAEDPGEHETYAPCRVDELAVHGYDYWALGHVHARRVLHERPWIVFPGNLQGRHARETGAKGCTLVSVEDGSIVAVEHRTVDVLRWASEELVVTGLDLRTLPGAVGDKAAAVLAGAEGRPVILRLILTGATALHGRLLDDTEHLASECRNRALDLGAELWVESVRVRTRPLVAAAADLLAPLRQEFLASLDDPAIAQALMEEFAKLRAGLPPGVRAGLDLPEDEADRRMLAEDGWASIADLLDAAAVP